YICHGIWQSPTGRALLWQAPVGLVSALLLTAAWRRRLRLLGRLRLPGLQATTPVTPAFYQHLLGLLSRRWGLRPQPGQTPLEFAQTAATTLCQGPATSAW